VSLIGSVLPASLVLPLTVFLAEMCVVTLGTIRIVFVSRGRRLLAPVLGFLEVVMWLFAIGQTMQNLSNPSCYIAFAAGFTAGNFLGLQVEKRLALGTVVLRIITSKDPSDLLEQFHRAGYGVTIVEGQGVTGPVKVVLTVVPRRELPALTSIMQAVDPKMFYSIDYPIRTSPITLRPGPFAGRGWNSRPHVAFSAASVSWQTEGTSSSRTA
jgi:uncharacterized protein YebE (UPF0316 family)